MRFFSLSPLLLLLVLLVSPAESVSAETRYVSDYLTVYIRKGPAVRFGIKRGLRSGTQLEVLQDDKEAGWTEVRLSDGDTGWVLTRELSTSQAARVQLERAKAAEATAKERLAATRTELARYRSGNRELESTQGQLSRENQELTRQLAELQDLTERTSSINQENQRLAEEVSQLGNENERLTRSNQQLRNGQDQFWFMVGAGVLILGAILGLLIPKIRWRKQDSWSSL